MGSTEARPRPAQWMANVGMLLAGVVVAVLVAEAVIRLVHAVVYGLGSRYYYPIVSDPVLGWRAVENFDSRSTKRDAAGAPYEVHCTTEENGFRLFGDLNASKPKVLIVGDSYTHAVDAGDGDTYYRVLKDAMNAEVFAYGSGGYGTLQEYLIIDRHIDRIRPDMVIVQFSSNDFANNSLDLERRSTDNNSRFRPYLTPDGTVRLAYPGRNGISNGLAGARAWLASHFRIMNEAFRAIDVLEPRILRSLGYSYVEPEIVARSGEVPEFREAVRITREIFTKIVRRAGKARVYAFSADAPEPYYTAFTSAARAAGVIVIDAPPRDLRREEQRGTCVRARDRSHWNPAGHRAVGESLAAYFTKEGVHVRSR